MEIIRQTLEPTTGLQQDVCRIYFQNLSAELRRKALAVIMRSLPCGYMVHEQKISEEDFPTALLRDEMSTNFHKVLIVRPDGDAFIIEE